MQHKIWHAKFVQSRIKPRGEGKKLTLPRRNTRTLHFPYRGAYNNIIMCGVHFWRVETFNDFVDLGIIRKGVDECVLWVGMPIEEYPSMLVLAPFAIASCHCVKLVTHFFMMEKPHLRWCWLAKSVATMNMYVHLTVPPHWVACDRRRREAIFPNGKKRKEKKRHRWCSCAKHNCEFGLFIRIG